PPSSFPSITRLSKSPRKGALSMSNRSIFGTSLLSLTICTGAALAEAPQVETERAPVSSNIGSRQIEELPTARRPIMQLLSQTPLGTALDKAGIDIYGHIEGGYDANFDPPANDQNAFRLFDFQNEKVILDQL